MQPRARIVALGLLGTFLATLPLRWYSLSRCLDSCTTPQPMAGWATLGGQFALLLVLGAGLFLLGSTTRLGLALGLVATIMAGAAIFIDPHFDLFRRISELQPAYHVALALLAGACIAFVAAMMSKRPIVKG